MLLLNNSALCPGRHVDKAKQCAIFDNRAIDGPILVPYYRVIGFGYEDKV